jgi:acetoin utilization deacetylase AcuC-like enzyme
MNLPTVLVQEGGYDLTTIGALVTETLAGVQEGATRA